MKDILDLHTHTIASGHAYNTLCEMAQAAAAKGLALYGCSDHAPQMPGSCHEFYFINFKVIPTELFGVKILMGAELNIMDYEGHVDLSEDTLSKLDYAVASLHPPCIHSGTIRQNTDAYLNVLKNPWVQIIGHPDDGRYPVDYEELTAAVKEAGKLLEVNNSSLNPRSFRPGARENYLKLLSICRRYQQPVIINSDAHFAADVGNHSFVHQLMEEIDFPEELVVNTSLEKLAQYIPRLGQILKGAQRP